MSHRKPNNFLQPRPPTLRADSSHAQRQNADAIILPIVYELAEPNRGCFKSDSVIVPITWPLRRVVTTTIIPLGVPGKFPDRKKKLALLKQKVELRRERAAKAKELRAQQAVKQAELIPQASKAGCSPTFVPLLLLSTILLVVFAWACFR